MSNSLDTPGAPADVADEERPAPNGTPLAALEGVEPEQWSALHWLGRALHVPDADLDATLEAILAKASVVISGADAAGVNLLIKGRFEPQAVFGAAPPVLDALQQRTGEGPCIEASREQQTISIRDVRQDRRWPQYSALAVDMGVLSMLCLPLYVDSARLGSLSFYGSRAAAFDEHATHLAELYAVHAALALADAQRAANLRIALQNRDTIGQAKGILIERHRITPDQAFALLSRSSQQSNRKLVEIAETVILTGEVPAR